MNNKNDSISSFYSLMDVLKEYIPNINHYSFHINLEIYDAKNLHTHVLSDSIEDTGSNLYQDNTYTIVYDPDHDCPSRIEDSYYADNLDDLVTIVTYFMEHEEDFYNNTLAYDLLIEDPDKYYHSYS